MTGRKGLRMAYRSIRWSMVCWPLAMPARSFSRKARTQAAQISGTTVAEGADAAVAAGEYIVGEVVVKAGVDLELGDLGLDDLDELPVWSMPGTVSFMPTMLGCILAKASTVSGGIV